MTSTTAAFVATEEFKGLFADYPYTEAEETQSKWNDDVATNGDYEIDITPTGYVSLQDPDTIDEAFTQVGNNGLVQYLLNTYDAVVVIDNRCCLSGGWGKAKVSKAGTDDAYGYVSFYNRNATIGHELAHIYGCSHEGEETHWQNYGVSSYDVVGKATGDYAQSCNDNDPNLYRQFRFMHCARERIREYIDSSPI